MMFYFLTIHHRVINVTIAFFLVDKITWFQSFGEIIVDLWSLYKSVSALYWKYYYYGLIDLIDIYKYFLLFISCQYAI